MYGHIPLYILLLLLILMPVAEAEDGQSAAAKVAEDAVTGGIMGFILDWADQCLLSGMGVQTAALDNPEEYTNSEQAIFRIAGYRIDPYGVDVIRDFALATMGIYVVGGLFVLFIAAILHQLQIVRPKWVYSATKAATGRPIYFELDEYIETWACLMAWPFVAPAALWCALYLNDIFVSGSMLSVLDQVSLTKDNVPLYFFMAVCYLVLSVGVAVRIIVILYTSAMIFIIGLGVAFKPTRTLAGLVLGYAIGLVFLQTIMVSLTALTIKVVVSGQVNLLQEIVMYAGLSFRCVRVIFPCSIFFPEFSPFEM